MIVSHGEKIVYRNPKGRKPKPIAVHCWFPVESDPIPTMLKLKNEDEEIVTIKQIEILSTEKFSTGGAKMVEYHCKILLPSLIMQEVYIHFHYENLRWTLSLK